MAIPLFTQYPSLQQQLPHIDFASLPTPIQHIPINDGEHHLRNLWIKRDDLTHPEYGGNKVRKLEFIIADAKSRSASEIITFGAIGTNHGVATALFCKKYDLKCTIFLFDQPMTHTVKQNLKLMASLGATLIYKGSLAKTVMAFYWHALRAKKHQYPLFAGGSNTAGCFGFVNAAFELTQQIERGEMPEPDYIICPVGSSATLAGLTLGCALASQKTQPNQKPRLNQKPKVIGIRVAPSHLGFIPVCTTKTVEQLMNQTWKTLRRITKTPQRSLPSVHLLDDYFGDAYGLATKDSEHALEIFSSVGIKLESTYTAKTVAAVLDFAKREPKKNILYWHTFNSAETDTLIMEEQCRDIQPFLKATEST